MLGHIGPVATWLAWKKFFDKINTTAGFPKSIILDVKHENNPLEQPVYIWNFTRSSRLKLLDENMKQMLVGPEDFLHPKFLMIESWQRQTGGLTF